MFMFVTMNTYWIEYHINNRPDCAKTSEKSHNPTQMMRFEVAVHHGGTSYATGE